MAINFPNSPVNGNTYTYQDTEYMFTQSSGQEGYWKVVQPIASGIANVQEIDDGQEPVKYITPENLELSKYNKARPWSVTVSNIGAVGFDIAKTYIDGGDGTNSAKNSTISMEYSTENTSYTHPDTTLRVSEFEENPIILDGNIRIDKISIVADAMSVYKKDFTNPILEVDVTVVNRTLQGFGSAHTGSGEQLSHTYSIEVPRIFCDDNFELVRGPDSLQDGKIGGSIEDPKLYGKDALNASNETQTTLAVYVDLVNIWSNADWIDFESAVEADADGKIKALQNFRITLEGVYL